MVDFKRTGRISLSEIEKTEATYLGTRIEIGLRADLMLGRGEKLDCNIDGYDFDVKWSKHQSYMIPQEAIDKHCLIIGINQNNDLFQVGVIKCHPFLLGKDNQDKKKSFKACKDRITGIDRSEYVAWIIREAALGLNLGLPGVNCDWQRRRWSKSLLTQISK